MEHKPYRIGELAKRSGVSAKTIRFYSDIGLLPPISIEESGYRLYSDAEHARLTLIRTLREIGIDLPTIGRLLQREVTPESVLMLHLEVIELEVRALLRQRTLLRHALHKSGSATLGYLQQLRAFAQLTALERERFLDTHLERAFDGVAVDTGWKANFWRLAVLDLPEESTEEQLSAWLELAELVENEDFIQRLNRMARFAWQRSADSSEANEDMNAVYGAAVEALNKAVTPNSTEGQSVIERYIRFYARVFGVEEHDPALPDRIRALVEEHNDPRAARFWELIQIVRGISEPSRIGDAHAWLMAGLDARIEAGR